MIGPRLRYNSKRQPGGRCGPDGPTQGFGAAFGKAIEGTPWAADLVDVGTTALVGAENASGIGEAKLIYDGVTYMGAVGGCLAGVIH